MLHSAGGRLDWPHRRTDDLASPGWTRWAKGIVKHRVIAAGTALLILGALVIAATTMHPGISDLDTLAKQGDAKQGLAALQDSGIGGGTLLPEEVLVSGGASPEAVASALGERRRHPRRSRADGPVLARGRQRDRARLPDPRRLHG